MASDFKKHFTKTNEFLKWFKKLFFILSGRKSRFLNFLRGKNGGNAKKHQTRTPKVGALGLTRPYIMQTVILFGNFINKEMSWGRNLVNNSLVQLEEMYQDRKFMKKPHAQLNLVKVKRPTLLKYLYYFEEKMPHVTQVHKKMECLLHFLTMNASGSVKNLFLG